MLFRKIANKVFFFFKGKKKKMVVEMEDRNGVKWCEMVCNGV